MNTPLPTLQCTNCGEYWPIDDFLHFSGWCKYCEHAIHPRNNIDYWDWKREVFERDGYKCRSCGRHDGEKLESEFEVRMIGDIWSKKGEPKTDRRYFVIWVHEHHVYIEAHHIKQVKDYPELIYSVNNGITLCGEHHKLAHKHKRFKEKIRREANSMELIMPNIPINRTLSEF